MSAAAETNNDTTVHQKVLVVDDEESIRLTIKELFAMEGIEVITADGPEQCLQFLRDGFRGLILMDIMMPKKNGWDTIRDIKNAGMLEGNIIAMLSSMDSPDERMEGLQEIVIDYITKPFDPEVLIATVRKYFGYLEHTHHHVGS